MQDAWNIPACVKAIIISHFKFATWHVTCRGLVREFLTIMDFDGRRRFQRPWQQLISRTKLAWNDLANSPRPPHVATNDVNPVGIRQAGRDANVDGHVKTSMLSRSWNPEHIRTTLEVKATRWNC